MPVSSTWVMAILAKRNTWVGCSASSSIYRPSDDDRIPRRPHDALHHAHFTSWQARAASFRPERAALAGQAGTGAAGFIVGAAGPGRAHSRDRQLRRGA